MPVLEFKKKTKEKEEFTPYFEILMYRNAYLNYHYDYGLPDSKEPYTLKQFRGLLCGHEDLIPEDEVDEFIDFMTAGLNGAFAFAFINNEVTENDKKYEAAKARQVREKRRIICPVELFEFLLNVQGKQEMRMLAEIKNIIEEKRDKTLFSSCLDIICIREWFQCSEKDIEYMEGFCEIGDVQYHDLTLRKALSNIT